MSTLVLYYVLFAEIFVLGMLLIRMRKGGPEFDHFRLMSPRQRLVSYVFFWVMAVVLAPVVAPIMAFSLFKGRFTTDHYWKNVRETHFEVALEPVHACNLSAELGEYISRESVILGSLGFQSLGHWWMKPEPFNSQVSFFLHPDGISMAEIGVTLEQLFCEISSYLQDGSIVVTVNCEPFNATKFARHGFYVRFCPGQEMADLVDAHQSFLREIANQRNLEVRRLLASNWTEYAHYHNRRFSQIKYALGECREPIECVFPAASTATNESSADTNLSADTTPIPASQFRVYP